MEENNADAFIIGEHEFIFAKHKQPAFKAYIECRERFSGDLAILDTPFLRKQVARALSETKLLFDTLWVGARIKPGTDQWWWGKRLNLTKQLDRDIQDNFAYIDVSVNESFPRECLGFGREDHSTPQFRPLNCKVYRSYICQRESIF